MTDCIGGGGAAGGSSSQRFTCLVIPPIRRASERPDIEAGGSLFVPFDWSWKFVSGKSSLGESSMVGPSLDSSWLKAPVMIRW